MEVRAVKKVSVYGRLSGQPVKNRVCSYWLQGRCNRNPCRFLHRESPPPQTEEYQSSPSNDFHRRQSRTTWRNPNHSTPKTVTISSNKRSPIDSTSHQITQPKVAVESRRKSGHMNEEKAIACNGSDSVMQDQPKVLTAVRAEPEKRSVQKAQRMQCKYWVAGNCVHGDKCKDLHSWFCGSGFTKLTKLEGHTKAITGISLPSGCDKLYSGGKDGFLRAWDCNSGQCVGSVVTDGEVGCIIAEGSWLLVGLPNFVKGWNLQNHAEFSVDGPAGLVHSIVVENDMLFAGTEDVTILVWKWHLETSIPQPAAMLKEHKAAVCSLVVGANRLYSASRDCTIKVWDLQNLQCVRTLCGHTRDVMSVVCWDSYLLSASLDKTLKVWSATESGTIEVVYEMKEDYGVVALCGIHDADAKPILLCSCSDNTVRLYDLPSFAERGRIFSKHEVQVIQIGIEGLFFTGDATGEISVWKLHGAPCVTPS